MRIFALCVAAVLVLCLPLRAPADNAVLTRAEWASFLHDPYLKAADEKLNATYKNALSGLSRQDRDDLVQRQRAWITGRNDAALAGRPKGSPEFLRALADMTLEREAELRQAYPASKPETAPVAAKETPPSRPGKPEPAAKAGNRISVPEASSKSRTINITPAVFAGKYNRLAADQNTLFFPKAPTGATESGHSRTENYRVSGAIAVQFKYGNGYFDQPEIINFTARRFMTGPENGRNETLLALANLVKALSAPSSENAAQQADIDTFVHGIRDGFDADASRIWKHAGLVYVVTYMHQHDILAMVATIDASAR